jgi:predicted nucleic acid-binding protein
LIAYFDTSAIVPLLIDEAGTERARAQWLGADRLVTIRLALVEARAAVAQAVRSGRITRAEHRRFVSDLPGLLEQVEFVDVDDALVRTAADIAEARSLRAYDAVHLAAAVGVGGSDLVVVAGDGALLVAATDEGLMTVPTS